MSDLNRDLDPNSVFSAQLENETPEPDLDKQYSSVASTTTTTTTTAAIVAPVSPTGFWFQLTLPGQQSPPEMVDVF